MQHPMSDEIRALARCNFHVKVRDLDPTFQAALASVEYHRADISVEGSAQASMLGAGMAGSRAFAILIDLGSGKYETHWGSWGGANMFSPGNPVDLDSNRYPIPPTGAVITGSKGMTTFANIVVHPDLLPKFLPEPTAELTQEEKDALYCYRSIKGGSYRQDELRERKVSEACIRSLVERGLLKQDGRGFRQITTEGKNAIAGYQGY